MLRVRWRAVMAILLQSDPRSALMGDSGQSQASANANRARWGGNVTQGLPPIRLLSRSPGVEGKAPDLVGGFDAPFPALLASPPPPVPEWRNWQTRRTQNPESRKRRGGSTPPSGTII